MAIANDPAALWAVIVRCQCKKGQAGMENVVANMYKVIQSYILYMHIDVHYILIHIDTVSIIHNLQDTSLLLGVGNAFLRIHLLLSIFSWDPLSCLERVLHMAPTATSSQHVCYAVFGGWMAGMANWIPGR